MRRHRGQFQFAVGSSGTINAIERALIGSRISTDGITPKALENSVNESEKLATTNQ